MGSGYDRGGGSRFSEVEGEFGGDRWQEYHLVLVTGAVWKKMNSKGGKGGGLTFV